MSLPPGGYQPANISFRDAGNEIGTMGFYGPELNAGNFAAKTALWDTLLDKTDDLVLGRRSKDVYNDESIYAYGQPTNGAARELKLLVQFQDTVTGERMTTSIPTLNPGIPSYVVNINARDVVELDTPSQVVDWITAFEAFAVNPRTGNSINVTGLKVVGRAT